MKLLLASKSPRRRQLLSELGYGVEFVDIDVDETLERPLAADRVAEHLACRKADACPTTLLGAGTVLVTADTVVVHRGEVLGKPHGRDEALRMLRSLMGERHEVFTGVCLRSARERRSFTERTLITFAPLGEAELEYYVDTYRPYDKAGSYGIQEWIGMVGVTGIEGDYYNVMGLPVARLYAELKGMQE